MACMLFLFMMQAAFESLEQKLTCKHFEFCYFPDNIEKQKSQNDCFLSQDMAHIEKTININSVPLYIDDETFFFDTCQEMEQAAQDIHDHLNPICLQVLIGAGNQQLKTEAMFFA